MINKIVTQWFWHAVIRYVFLVSNKVTKIRRSSVPWIWYITNTLLSVMFRETGKFRLALTCMKIDNTLSSEYAQLIKERQNSFVRVTDLNYCVRIAYHRIGAKVILSSHLRKWSNQLIKLSASKLITAKTNSEMPKTEFKI